MSSSSALLNSPTGYSFQCCICLDLLYKPIVLACGHISCFWCTHEWMDGVRPSHCAICRREYSHFPNICELLHHLLMKLEPLTIKFREKEIQVEENMRECFSPRLGNKLGSKIVYQLSPDDVLCYVCNELLLRPSVLNCGHVFCESCISSTQNGYLKCQICERLHPSNYPNICWELDSFLQEQFPKQYASRRENVQIKKLQCGEPSDSTLDFERLSAKSSHLSDEDASKLYGDLSKANVRVGCDGCGMYPIIGNRYKCKDCKEKIGYDLCQACYTTNSKLPGRFNQHHAQNHKLELDESRMLSTLLMQSGC